MKKFLMNNDLKKAKTLLTGDVTLALVKDEAVYLASEKGVMALIDYIDEGMDFSGFSVADVVVGKASAFLFKKLKIKSVYTPTISTPSLEILEKAGIDVDFDKEVPNILNKKRDGLCPMEELLVDVKNEEVAYKKMKEKIKKMREQIFSFK